MHRFLILGFVLSCLLYNQNEGFAQRIPLTRAEHNIHGPVKRWSETVQEVDGVRYSMLLNDVMEFTEEGQLKFQAAFNQGGLLESKLERVIDKKGRVLEEADYVARGKIATRMYEYDSLTGKLSVIKDFDEFNNLQRIRRIVLDSVDRVIRENWYNERGQYLGRKDVVIAPDSSKIEEVERGPTNLTLRRTVSSYDARGNLIRKVYLEPIQRHREDEYIQEFEFNEANLLVRESLRESNGNLKSETRLEYDGNGHVKRAEQFGTHGKKEGYFEMQVSKDGLEVISRKYSDLGNLLLTLREEQKRDEHMNTIELKRYVDGELKLYVKRVIQYYQTPKGE